MTGGDNPTTPETWPDEALLALMHPQFRLGFFTARREIAELAAAQCDDEAPSAGWNEACEHIAHLIREGTGHVS